MTIPQKAIFIHALWYCFKGVLTLCNEIKVNDGKEVIGTINFADIITDTVKDFNKIKSNTARLSNRRKERYCKNYNIRTGERILAKNIWSQPCRS